MDLRKMNFYPGGILFAFCDECVSNTPAWIKRQVQFSLAMMHYQKDPSWYSRTGLCKLLFIAVITISQ
jgi:hypothetical protein